MFGNGAPLARRGGYGLGGVPGGDMEVGDDAGRYGVTCACGKGTLLARCGMHGAMQVSSVRS
eukprot:4744601-Prorocentrum_lima.AAC.1